MDPNQTNPGSRRRIPVRLLAAGIGCLLVAAWLSRGVLGGLMTALLPRKSVAERLAEYGPDARARLAPHFQRAGVAFPPTEIWLVGLKAERELQLYAADPAARPRHIRSWPILAASGTAGPKLREGDRQVPEGLYSIESLNPNSRFHLALRVDYPNTYDRARAAEDGRTTLGGDIMIHGGSSSVGCLAVGDDAIEEVFVLAADVGVTNVHVLLSPVDFRRGTRPPTIDTMPLWTAFLHAMIESRLAGFPVPTPSSR